MSKLLFDSERPGSQEISWCPGCGDFAILEVLKKSLENLNKTPQQTAIISGIGQAGKLPHYIHSNGFHTLHGRALPIATGVKGANPELTVVAVGGDGDMYAEGGNHFLHVLRRNPDITVLVHNNQIYGLTKGQGSPTTLEGMKTTTQPHGVTEEPINAIAIAIAQNASFVARSFIGHKELTQDLIEQAIEHKGLAVVEIFQPCVSFNKLNTYAWYKEHCRIIEDHDPSDRTAALALALDTERYPLGILYRRNDKKTYEEQQAAYQRYTTPLWQRKVDREALQQLLNSKK
ncbi:thiamine pyrophosphate-dependent enzyme [uncultured Desulfuromonas sp.]|uniref:thiamine pyrophosphate-dependent enzyme n=1 Tax=uncultured Desulfuromonas sp. TaxID=181013 RepID=UPI002AAB54B3|nr:thiamine pyrophosphate-dependent enzyme [uncultured Desulfuromonas sp.]